MKNGIELIAEERQEQITKHGRTTELDVQQNDRNQLTHAAGVLCAEDWGCNDIDDIKEDFCPLNWDKDQWAKMCDKPYEQRLVIAGALIAAEIDRLQATEK